MVHLEEKVLATGFICMTEDELYAVNGGMRSQPDLIDGGGYLLPSSYQNQVAARISSSLCLG